MQNVAWIIFSCTESGSTTFFRHTIRSPQNADKMFILSSRILILLIIIIIFAPLSYLPISIVSIPLSKYLVPSSSLHTSLSSTLLSENILSSEIIASWITYRSVSLHLRLTSRYTECMLSFWNGFNNGIYSKVLISVILSGHAQQIFGGDISLNLRHDEIFHAVSVYHISRKNQILSLFRWCYFDVNVLENLFRHPSHFLLPSHFGESSSSYQSPSSMPTLLYVLIFYELFAT